jgi:7-cyano-7-deazaguanine synthase in queuosine biosynthesis
VRRYIENNLIDLFDITRSCEGEFKELNYKTYQPYQPVPVCGKCFWCLEREWGIKNALK